LKRGAVILATVALAAILGGCFSSGSGIQQGERVKVYVSMPLRGPEARNGRDVVDAARLAVADAKGRVGQLRIRAVYLDDTAGHGAKARWSPAAAAGNARRASQDSSTIAYIGDFDSGATRSSLPITNEAHILQVSPASTAVDLVQPFLGAGDQMPEEVQPTGQRTFGRVIPSDDEQARAGATWAKRRKFPAVNVFSDGSSFGRTMTAAFDDEAHAIGLKPRRTPFGNPAKRLRCQPARGHAQSHAYYAGVTIPSRAQVQCALAPARVSRLITTDAMLSPEAIRAFGPRPDLQITSAAQDPTQLPDAGQDFLRSFRDRYRRAPGRYAAYGYEAMAVVLDSIRRAGDSGADRDAVIDAFFDTANRHSVLGTYSIDDVGNSTLDRLAGYRVRHGRAVFETDLSPDP